MHVCPGCAYCAGMYTLYFCVFHTNLLPQIILRIKLKSGSNNCTTLNLVTFGVPGSFGIIVCNTRAHRFEEKP